MSSFRPVGRAALGMVLGTVLSGALFAADEETAAPAPLPETLTLEYALSLADEPHPDLLSAQAELDIAKAGEMEAAANTGFNASVFGQLRWVEPPSDASDQSHNDSAIQLRLSKRLYDFGRTEASEGAAQAEAKSSELLFTDTRLQRRIDIMQRYFDVLLADLEYARHNEDMAIRFVRMDRAQDRFELGQLSEVDLLETQTKFQETRRARAAAEAKQRTSRARLAEVLNRRGQLPVNLARPELPQNDQAVPELNGLLAAVEAQNPLLKALREKAEAARQRLEAARAGARPVVTGEVEFSEYARELSSRDPVRAGVYVEIPLLTGGAVQADVAKRRAELNLAQAELEGAAIDLRQAVYTAWEQLNRLRVEREEAQVRTAYRDLYLDLRRGQYELEQAPNIGDAMVEYTDARLKAAQAEFELAMTWAQLNALMGKPVYAEEEEPAAAAAAEPGA